MREKKLQGVLNSKQVNRSLESEESVHTHGDVSDDDSPLSQVRKNILPTGYLYTRLELVPLTRF